MITGVLNIDYQTYREDESEIYNHIREMVKNGEIKCPACGRHMYMNGTYKRKIIISEFESHMIPIARVRCKKCRRGHSIIPDFILPYKLYYYQLIQNAVDSDLSSCSADESTIRRWRKVLAR